MPPATPGQVRVAHQRRAGPWGSRCAGRPEKTSHRGASVDYYPSNMDAAAKRHDRRSGTMTTSSRLALGVAFAAVLAGAGAAQKPSSATDWPASNYNESANRYSPLDQINTANVATLQPAWRFHLKPAGYTGALKEDEA